MTTDRVESVDRERPRHSGPPPRVCAGCGCLCDDIRIQVEASRIVAAEGACDPGRDWLIGRGPLVATVETGGAGEDPPSLEEASRRAAAWLAGATAPVILGLGQLTIEAQRVLVEIAERLRCPLVAWPPPSDSAAVGSGVPEFRASLDVVRASADLVLFWRADPHLSHPRHLERYTGGALTAPGTAGAPRTIVHLVAERAMDRGSAPSLGLDETTELVSLRLPEDPSGTIDVHLVQTLRRLLEEGDSDAFLDLEALRLRPETVRELAGRLRAARRIQVYLGETVSRSVALREQWQLLGANLQDTHRFGLAGLPPRGNGRGLAEVVGWQTGLPLPVDFLDGGAPRHRPDVVGTRRPFSAAACDLLFTAGLDRSLPPGSSEAPGAPYPRRLHLGPRPDPDAEMSFVVPGLDPRARGRVIRDDGVVLWLCGEPDLGEPDPAGLLLESIRRALDSSGIRKASERPAGGSP